MALPRPRGTPIRYVGATAIRVTGSPTLVLNYYGGMGVTLGAGTGAEIIIPPPRPTAQYGRFLAAKTVRVCYAAEDPAVAITTTRLYFNELGATGEAVPINSGTIRYATTSTCDELPVPTPQAFVVRVCLYRALANGPGAARTLYLHSFALALTSLGAGAKVPGQGGGPPTVASAGVPRRPFARVAALWGGRRGPQRVRARNRAASARRECTDYYILLLGERYLQRALRAQVDYGNFARPYHGIGREGLAELPSAWCGRGERGCLPGPGRLPSRLTT